MFKSLPFPRYPRLRVRRKMTTRPLAGVGGFLLIEVLISAMILTSGIAATMYLFRVGYESLERVRQSNLVSSKIPYAVNFLQTEGYASASGSLALGDGVVLTWRGRTADKKEPVSSNENRPGLPLNPSESFSAPLRDMGVTLRSSMPKNFTLFLYKMDFTVSYMNLHRDYKLEVVRHLIFKRVEIFGHEI